MNNSYEIAANQLVEEKKYWLEKLSNNSVKKPFLYDYVRTGWDYEEKHLSFTLPQELNEKIIKITKGVDTNIHLLLLAGMASFICKYTNNKEIIIVTPVDEQETDTGLLNTILPIKMEVDDYKSFKDLLILTRKIVNEAIGNQNYPISSLLENDLGEESNTNSNLFDVGMLLENIQSKDYLEELRLNLIFSFLYKDGAINCKIDYNSLLFDNITIERFKNYIIDILKHSLENTDAPIWNYSKFKTEIQDHLIQFNNTQTLMPCEDMFIEHYKRQVVENYDKVALISEGEKLTYKNLDDEANRFAYQLQEFNIKKGTIVPIIMERSVEFVIAVLGVVKVGGAFLPIDVNYPNKRILKILKDVNAKVVISRMNAIQSIDKDICLVDVDSVRNNFKSEGDKSENKKEINFSPDDIAYVIYTSGSTGNPKGVLIQQGALANYLLWAKKTYVKQNYMHFPLFTSVSFDLTITSLLLPLISGNTITIFKNDKNTNILEQVVNHSEINIVKLTPTHLSLLENKSYENTSIKRMVVGGEALYNHQVIKAKKVFGEEIEIFNEYGPTEATVGCMIHKVDLNNNVSAKISIGTPIDNTGIFLCNDKNSDLTPWGQIGEICISGKGLALGYLNNVEYTSEKFIETSLLEEAKFYKTGDYAKWLPNGELDFVGRLDDQVKIKGHRVELKEIKQCILKNEHIEDAVVITYTDKNQQDLIVAYYQSNDKIHNEIIRKQLETELPQYLIPSYFIYLEKLPMNINGKLEKKMLPDPLNYMQENKIYKKPENEKQTILAQVWEDVLGIDNISIDENFFELGGDSIKAIQISSKLLKHGISLELKHLFQSPSIKELSKAIKEINRTISQEMVTGESKISPTKCWFFENYKNDPHHFNMSLMLHFKQDIPSKTLESIFSKILDHHDELRSTYVRKEDGVFQMIHGTDYPLVIKTYDLRNEVDIKTKLKELSNKYQASLNLQDGPLIKIIQFKLKDGDKVLIVLHHLVVDGVSWRILLEDVHILFDQYTSNQELVLPSKTDSYKFWTDKLLDYSKSQTLLSELEYWEKIESSNVPLIEYDYPSNYGGQLEDENILLTEFSQDLTSYLISKINTVFNTSLEDLLVTAIAIGVKNTFDINKTLISMEGHGREFIDGNVNINRTVGWFTTIFPVIINTEENNLKKLIKEVKETLRRIPNKGMGYQILKYLTSSSLKEGLQFDTKPQINFNYLGAFDTGGYKGSFEIANDDIGYQVSMNSEKTTDINILGYIVSEKLQLSIGYDKKQFNEKTIADLLKNIKVALENIRQYNHTGIDKEYSPSDFTYKELSIDLVSQLSQKYSLEDIYPLTPMQEGMLYHSLLEGSENVYIKQIAYKITGDIDIKAIENSFQELFKRHETLRAAFIHKYTDNLFQVVLKDRTGKFIYKDISDKNKRKQDIIINKIKEHDLERGFDLEEDTLMRLIVIKLDFDKYEFLWTHHHILLDGWCLGILLPEFNEIYKSIVEGRKYQLPDVKPFSVYLNWLGNVNKEKSKAFWKEYLKGYTITNPLQQINENKNVKYSPGLFIKEIENWSEIKRNTKNFMLTTANFIHAVWGVLVSKYTYNQDLAFGVVVSGRPQAIEGIDSMVGLFINTIPLRIKYTSGTRFNELVEEIQRVSVESTPYHNYPLARITSEHPLKHKLIDHIVVSGNYPINNLGERNDSKDYFDVQLSQVMDKQPSNYNLTLIIAQGDSLNIEFHYNKNIYSKDFIVQIANQLNILITQFTGNPDIKLSGVELEDIVENKLKQNCSTLNNKTDNQSSINLEFKI